MRHHRRCMSRHCHPVIGPVERRCGTATAACGFILAFKFANSAKLTLGPLFLLTGPYRGVRVPPRLGLIEPCLPSPAKAPPKVGRRLKIHTAARRNEVAHRPRPCWCQYLARVLIPCKNEL